ncbi:GGDEF domain-containing protein [Vibrio sp. SCSIO 43136]|uniref:GGDEF domain-containing protein n=1 Tax=Vibrio sp. SCSIO 43136 TaxID=2819101 RepID=UPI00207550F2|nr:GGDEF domain-containing protein [Vibrio sp. SCSIO 43136]USD66621.1 diguanylate cyclase [Vibrio sp. SCSIO 43136]
MTSLEQELQKEIQSLTHKLDQSRLSQRDSTFKFKREQGVLKRIITNLSDACLGQNGELDHRLSSLKTDIEQQQDLSRLIPKLVVLERMLKQNTVRMERQSDHLCEKVRQSGETLQRIPGLPAQLKRELRNLLQFPNEKLNKEIDQAGRLLSLYERATKIMASNSSRNNLAFNSPFDQEQLDTLTDQLQNLITEIDFDGDSGETLMDIRAKLLVGVQPNELFELILKILKLVIEGTHYERKSSEKLLDEVNSSLSSTLKSADQSLKQSQSYTEHRQSMHQELGELVDKSKATLRAETELEALKAAMSPLLEQIGSLTERLEHVEKREKQLIDRWQHERNQLETLHEKTQNYRRRLLEQAQRMQLDPLTKVYNRSALSEKLELEYRRWIRSQHSLRIATFDLDNFKVLNDSFGYTAGDKALKIIARTIKKSLSEKDIVARFSGEEFVVIMPEASDQKAREVLEKIQVQIGDLPFRFREQNIQITVSIASAAFKDSDTPEEVLDRLNTALRQSKRSGTNRISWL